MGRLITKGQLGLHLRRYLGKQRNKVPMKPTWSKVRGTNTQQCELSEQLLEHLERLSLVNFSNKEAIDRLSKAISFANEMKFIDTTGIEPMDSVLESRTLFLRDDVVTEGNCREAIMQNATRKIEEYFVAPPGNIPIIPTVSEVNRSTLPELEGKKLK